MRTKVAAFVDNRNVHGLLDFNGLLFGSGDYLTWLPQCHHESPSEERIVNGSPKLDCMSHTYETTT